MHKVFENQFVLIEQNSADEIFITRKFFNGSQTTLVRISETLNGIKMVPLRDIALTNYTMGVPGIEFLDLNNSVPKKEN